MFCSECGKKNIDHAKFCVECGTAISTKVQESAESKVNSRSNTKKDHSDTSRANGMINKLNENSGVSKQKLDQLSLFADYKNKINEDAKKGAEYKKLAREEWIKENGNRFKNPEDMEDIPLEDLKKKLIQLNIKEAEDTKGKKGFLVLFISLMFIFVAIISYLAKAYFFTTCTIILLILYWSMFKPKDPPNPNIICPHCKTKGQVYTKSINVKKGVSGGKATGAILTGGLSLLATGLSREETKTEAFCEKCRSIWNF